MEFNVTDRNLFLIANSAICTALVLLVVVPTLLLNVMCVLALIAENTVSKRVKALLINIFTAEICHWLRDISYYIFFPLRFTFPDLSIVCSVQVSIAIVSGIQRFIVTALYAIMVYIFVKGWEKNLRWAIIIPSIVVPWLVIISTFGILPYFDLFGLSIRTGFCHNDSTSILFRVIISISVILSATCVGIILICSIFTYVYVKHNTLGDDGTVKRAVTKVLIYFAIASIFGFVGGLLPASLPTIREAVGTTAIKLVAINYISRVVLSLPSVAIPVIAITILKPIRTAILSFERKVCPCCIHPTQPKATATQGDMTWRHIKRLTNICYYDVVKLIFHCVIISSSHVNPSFFVINLYDFSRVTGPTWGHF